VQVKASGINPVRAKLASAGLDDGCARFGETIRLSSDIANPLAGVGIGGRMVTDARLAPCRCGGAAGSRV
jgi:hypothetical protein